MKEQLDRQPIALKEWAVSVKALLEGKQIIVMRKGGIIEETRDFEVMSDSFYLMPAFEHQRKELLKEANQSKMDETMKEWSQNQDVIKLEAYAEVIQDIEISDQETLDKLRHLHIWTDTFAEERLKWKREKPLHLLLLKVYKLDEPIITPMRNIYNGCKSWVRLEDKLDTPAMTPVLSEELLMTELEKIKLALAE